jgi:hypothetical protein
MKKIHITLIAAALIANAASAITFSGFAATDLKGADTNNLANGSATFLIADGGDGFDFDATAAGLTFAVGSTVGATNDFVFAYNAAQDFTSVSVASGNAAFSNADAGSSASFGFALMFFDGVGGVSVTTAGGEQYGFYSEANWQIPANDAGTFSFGTDFTTISALTGTNGSVVPEPSTYAALAGLLALGYVMVRRRRA